MALKANDEFLALSKVKKMLGDTVGLSSVEKQTRLRNRGLVALNLFGESEPDYDLYLEYLEKADCLLEEMRFLEAEEAYNRSNPI